MENKINIAELLKDCPKGMELDCLMYDNLSYDYVNEEQNRIYCKVDLRDTVWFTIYGCVNLSPSSKCVIFPKGKTTWEGFQRPFKDGDIVVGENRVCSYIAIFRKFIDNTSFSHYVCLTSFGKFKVDDFSDNANLHFATEEEKRKLFDAIKANGYKWSSETKTLEKLPKFKIGDRVKHISAYTSGKVVKVFDKGYYIDYPKGEGVCYISFELEKDYELVPNKFDITTLKPFDKVLVRHNKDCFWLPSLFGLYDKGQDYPCICCNGFSYKYCIPYEDNEHLLGTTKDCDEYYKVWE